MGQAIGNAGSVNLAKYVANCIKENIDRAIVFDTTEEQLQQVNINDRQLKLFEYNDLKLTKNKNSDNISIDNDRSQKYLLTDRKTAPSR